MKDEKKMVELNEEEAEKVVGGSIKVMPPDYREDKPCDLRVMWIREAGTFSSDGKKKAWIKGMKHRCRVLAGEHRDCADNCPYYQAYKALNIK